MAKIFVFPSTTNGRRRAAERAVEVQRALGGRIIARPYQPRPPAGPDGSGPSAA